MAERAVDGSTSLQVRPMRPLEALALRDARWCTGALYFTSDVSAADAKRGSVAVCSLGEKLKEFTFVYVWATVFPMGESTPVSELGGMPKVLETIAKRLRNERAEHTEQFIAEIRDLRKLAVDLYKIRKSGDVVLRS